MTDDRPTNPTETPEFQRVVQHFLNTPHRPHAPLKHKPKTSRRSNRAASKSKRSLKGRA